MLTALRSGTDLHEFIARLVWGEDLKKDPSLLKLRRTWSKNLSFGLIYGIGKDALAKQLNVSPDKAKQILSSYLAAFPRIRPFMESVAGQCQRDGYVRLWSGRLWRESDPNAMYKAVNALVQGGAADLLMEAAIRGHQFVEQTHSGHLVSFIYDELLYEIKEDRVQEILFDFMRLHELEDIFKMPFLVTTKIGLSYGSLKEVDITVLKRG